VLLALYVLTRLVLGVAEGALRRPSLSSLDDQQLTFSSVEQTRTSFIAILRLYSLQSFSDTDGLERKHDNNYSSYKSKRD
jgi:hypothetical protein